MQLVAQIGTRIAGGRLDMKDRRRNFQLGFSLLETMVVIAVILIVVAGSILGFTNVLPDAKANSAMDQVISRLRVARERAISHRITVQVQFVGTNQMIVTEIWRIGNPPPPVTYTWEGSAQYMVFPGVPDTPEGLGNSSAVYFENQSGGPPIMEFTSAGSFVDGGNTFVNGTVFLGVSGKPATARAITILGATGRVRQYRWTGTRWTE